MQDYTIVKDSCGNRYLCHGIDWKNHKYIKKIGQGISALYFYTPDELKRYLQNVARTAQQTGKNIKTAGQEVAKKMQISSETANTVQDKIKGATQKIQPVKKTAEKVSSEAKRIVKEIKIPDVKSVKAKSAVEKVNDKNRPAESKKRSTPNMSSNQAQLDSAKKADEQSEKEDDLELLADWSDGRKPSGAHGFTSHGRKISGTAKEGWSKRRELPGSLEESSELLGGKTAMGKDYMQEMFKSALQQYAEELDDVRVKGSNFQSLKELEFEMARTKEINEDLKRQIDSTKGNFIQTGPVKSAKELLRLQTELKSSERSLKELERQHKDLQEYYDKTMADFETILEYYKDVYM